MSAAFTQGILIKAPCAFPAEEVQPLMGTFHGSVLSSAAEELMLVSVVETQDEKLATALKARGQRSNTVCFLLWAPGVWR